MSKGAFCIIDSFWRKKMAETKATVRVEKNIYGGKVGQSFCVNFLEGNVFFPASITEIEMHEKFVDLTCPLWFVSKNELNAYVVAEF
jgi:hypothetical protein